MTAKKKELSLPADLVTAVAESVTLITKAETAHEVLIRQAYALGIVRGIDLLSRISVTAHAEAIKRIRNCADAHILLLKATR